ncbi:hypothetical protein Nepgr_027555 [Nepenthes gracilis]|uniref:CCT domain-containing protein n=1 Tax=Nepenthes gracilis TaxID=150966 RepID=A0AAD3TBY2_NEPGR|nr:hypothetical protein Nepgr_027555 [Nepenthes gracilis]
MCSRSSENQSLKSKTSSRKSTKKTKIFSMKPARKARTKIRKPKFLSLRLKLSPENTQQSTQMTATPTIEKQLNLFPLHPENVTDQEMEMNVQDHENMAYYFAATDGGATSLMGLLNASSTTEEEEEEEADLSTSLYGGTAATVELESEKGSLVRSALRNRERDASEEKWVCISEVIEHKEEEVTSCAVKMRRHRGGGGGGGGLALKLKLDYEEVLNAWCDKGPLYIEAECPQTVPDFYDDYLFQDCGTDLNGQLGGLWSVPEKSSIGMEEGNEGRGGKTKHRKASVLRYKEKRQSRLFSKRIRYEVRKLNAEKRPRVKGRFVKRN